MAVLRNGAEHQPHASQLADHLTDHRNQLDGVPSAAEIRRAAALRAQQHQAFRHGPGHEPPTPSAGIEL